MRGSSGEPLFHVKHRADRQRDVHNLHILDRNHRIRVDRRRSRLSLSLGSICRVVFDPHRRMRSERHDTWRGAWLVPPEAFATR